MTQWNLSRLRQTVRNITGKLDPTQIPDSSISTIPIGPNNPPGIDDFINDFYLGDFDEHLRTLKLKTYYTFQTTPNVGTYSLPSNLSGSNFNTVYYDACPPFYVDGYEIAWHQDPDNFYRIWPQLDFVDAQIATGNNGTTYSFTLTQTPIQQGTVVIGVQNSSTPGVQNETFTDQDCDGTTTIGQTAPQFVNPGALYSSISGLQTTSPGGVSSTINYLTGAVTVTFSAGVATGASINAHYYAYVASRPRDVLFFNQKFFLKPIPDDTYSIKMVAYQQPTVVLASGSSSSQFSNSSDSPTYNEWWQVIAYGAALKIMVEDGDHEEYARNEGYFERAKILAQRRALKQLSNQRIPSLYSEGGNMGSSWAIYPQY